MHVEGESGGQEKYFFWQLWGRGGIAEIFLLKCDFFILPHPLGKKISIWFFSIVRWRSGTWRKPFYKIRRIAYVYNLINICIWIKVSIQKGSQIEELRYRRTNRHSCVSYSMINFLFFLTNMSRTLLCAHFAVKLFTLFIIKSFVLTELHSQMTHKNIFIWPYGSYKKNRETWLCWNQMTIPLSTYKFTVISINFQLFYSIPSNLNLI